MKNILITLISFMLLMVAVNVTGQTTKAKTLGAKNYVFQDEADYSLTILGDSVLVYTFTLNKADDVFYDVQVSLDSVGGTPNYVVDLQGRVFPADSWTDLETDVNWTGTSTDTTILFQEHSTAVFMRQFKLSISGAAATGAATLNLTELKLWP